MTKHIPYKGHCGIYYLYRGKELLYIGQSKHIEKRIQDHTHIGFDSYCFEELAEENLLSAEIEAIEKNRPKLNKPKAPPFRPQLPMAGASISSLTLPS